MNGQVRLLEPLVGHERRRALVTILDSPPEPAAGERSRGSGQRILELLNSPEFRDLPYGSAEEMERTIQENRQAWGD